MSGRAIDRFTMCVYDMCTLLTLYCLCVCVCVCVCVCLLGFSSTALERNLAFIKIMTACTIIIQPILYNNI